MVAKRSAVAADVAAAREQDRMRALWIAEALSGPVGELVAEKVADHLRKHPPLQPIAVSFDEAAALLSVGRDKIYELADAGTLPSVRLDGRRLIRVTDLTNFVATLPDGAKKSGRAS